MTKNIADQLKAIQIALLQLQRSALIDTQTIMQLLVDKGICDIEDIVSTRTKIESESEDISRIDREIEIAGGSIVQTPVPKMVTDKEDLKKQLIALIEELGTST